MKLLVRGIRTTAPLCEATRRRLDMYALAAGAAGVGVLAMAQPVEARVIYTHTNKTLGYGILNLDLNHDGKRDFALCLSFYRATTSMTSHPYSCPAARRRVGSGRAGRPPRSGFASALSIYPAKRQGKRNQILGNTSGAYALPAGIVVGPKQKFTAGARDMATWGSTRGSQFASGPWKDAQKRYLALKFVIKCKVHYGWARLNVNSLDRVHATLTGFAYETIPNKPITTGKTKASDDLHERTPNPVSLAPPNPGPGSLGNLATGFSKLTAGKAGR